MYVMGNGMLSVDFVVFEAESMNVRHIHQQDCPQCVCVTG